MKIYIISDTHFNHKNIIQLAGRPENFESIIKDNLLVVKDILIHLGDISFGSDKEYSNWFKNTLSCRTFLIKGNHDKKSTEWYLENGWDWVGERMDITYKGKKLCFTHEPIEYNGDYNIHGHLHEKEGIGGNHILISLEKNNYKPYLLEKLL